jgi:HEAT repeat protein
VAETDELLEALRSPDWRVAADAAEQLKSVPGERVARALADALDADDTAITEAALESLLARDEPYGADLSWAALTTLDDDLTMHIWGFLYPYPNHPITLELKRRERARR